MKLVIDISKEDYQALKKGHVPFNMLNVIMNGTPLPQNATNGDVIKTVFEVKDIVENFMMQTITVTMNGTRKTFGRDWWNAPYKADKESVE